MYQYFNLDTLNGYQFEELVARIMKKIGYHEIILTPKSNDKGKDIIMKFKDDNISYPVIVECKHQDFVGRPIVQKLQGAMIHEMKKNKFIKGIIVTSGDFSPTAYEYVKEINHDHSMTMEVELINGNQLRKLCEKHEIIILNGKIQIITNNCVNFLDSGEVRDQIFKEFHKIIGNKDDLLKFESQNIFYPCYYIRYDIDSQFCTSIGCVNTIKKSGEEIFLEGVSADKIRDNLKLHFFDKGFPKIVQLNKKKGHIIPFEFTENDLEETAFNVIINENTEKIKYYGKNNQGYTKICVPNSRDIDLKETRAVYLPKIINRIQIKNQSYSQEIFSNKHNLLYDKNEFNECKNCKRDSTFLDSHLYFCAKCGRILCSYHKRLDNLDKTPVCLKCALKKRLWLQTKFFISEKNKNKYLNNYKKMNFLRKVYEDKIIFLGGIGLISILLVSLINIL